MELIFSGNSLSRERINTMDRNWIRPRHNFNSPWSNRLQQTEFCQENQRYASLTVQMLGSFSCSYRDLS